MSTVSDIERQMRILRDRVDDLEKLQNQRNYVPKRGTDDAADMWALTFLGDGEVRIGTGEIHDGTLPIVDVAQADIAVTADHQYVWVEYILGGDGEATLAGPSTVRPESSDADNTYRTWLYLFRLVAGVVSVEKRGHRGTIELPGNYAS